MNDLQNPPLDTSRRQMSKLVFTSLYFLSAVTDVCVGTHMNAIDVIMHTLWRVLELVSIILTELRD